MHSEECYPIKSLEEVLRWKPIDIGHRVEAMRWRTKSKEFPRTLLCHDMMGGYLDDRFVHGVAKTDCYRFFHWANIDSFVYFSHNFVTIPPCGWITAAHKNGTLILGTFITEWEDGAKICKDFLTSSTTVNSLASQLVSIAKYYGFDGWLLNIENEIEPENVDNLEEFVSTLTKMMHIEVPNSLIIWYDSVITTGKLKWQNALNENNKRFFDSCDGIFLNYTWKEEHLKKSVEVAQSRILDVYVGVDVFGRGCCGGGGFSTNVAVKQARELGLSVAIFAPGWVYESLERNSFTDNQYKFWNLLSELSPIHCHAKLPFISSFCQGFGKKLFRKGKVVSNNPWTNLALQQPQPTYHHQQGLSLNIAAIIYNEDAYNGGGCLKLHGLHNHENRHYTFKLFSSNFPLTQTTAISYTFKPVSPHSLNCVLLLHLTDNQSSYCIQLAGDQNQPGSNKTDQNKFDSNKAREVTCKTVTAIKDSNERILFHSSKSFEAFLDTKELGELPADIEEGWITRMYVLTNSEYQDHIITAIDAVVLDIPEEEKDFTVLLGQIQVLPLPVENSKPAFGELLSSDISKKTENDLNVSISATLNWKMPLLNDVECWDIYACCCGEKTYCGTTAQNYYKLTNVMINFKNKKDADHIEFHVQPSGFIHNTHKKLNLLSVKV